jgi:pyruvate/2-oxoglutarate dehydrogenase complex dihydrolipoamide acyltransferase (E2) component
MKKIKISELPLYQSLKGLFVMGTDVNNRSVKVNLEFIESETTKAVKDADTATAAAAKAAGLADEATKTANAAALRADTAQAQAAKAASDAAQSALSAKTQADDAAKAAQDAAEAAQAAKTAADEATTLTKAATEASEKATAAAKSATDKVLDTLGKIVPTGLSVKSVPRLTLGNVNPVYLKAVLSPDTALKNLIYISDNRAVEVGLDGRISILNKGVSRVHIIPTCNTALARSVLIEVGEPTLRLVTTRRQMRFTQSGALRMN